MIDFSNLTNRYLMVFSGLNPIDLLSTIMAYAHN